MLKDCIVIKVLYEFRWWFLAAVIAPGFLWDKIKEIVPHLL